MRSVICFNKGCWSSICLGSFVSFPNLYELTVLYPEPQKFSKDGYEEHMQVNQLAPALLSILLLPSLIRGSPSRIINVNSVVSSTIMVHIRGNYTLCPLSHLLHCAPYHIFYIVHPKHSVDSWDISHLRGWTLWFLVVWWSQKIEIES